MSPGYVGDSLETSCVQTQDKVVFFLPKRVIEKKWKGGLLHSKARKKRSDGAGRISNLF